MKGKILIGTLARYFGISKQTLHHYDKVGVLKPVIDDENGYRYYTYEDVDKLSLIISLKTAGLTLHEIQSYLNNTSYDYTMMLLQKQTDNLENQILKLQEAKLKIEFKMLEMKKERDFVYTDEIRLESLSERPILKQGIVNDMRTGPSISLTARKLSEYIDNHHEYYRCAHVQESVSLDIESIRQGDYKNFTSAFVFIDDYCKKAKEEILASGLYVCKYYKGVYSNTDDAYKKILEYLKKERLKVVGDALEIPVLTVWSIEEEEAFVMEIQIPVVYI